MLVAQKLHVLCMHFISFFFFFVAYLLHLYNKQFLFYVDLVDGNALVYKIFTKSSKVLLLSKIIIK